LAPAARTGVFAFESRRFRGSAAAARTAALRGLPQRADPDFNFWLKSDYAIESKYVVDDEDENGYRSNAIQFVLRLSEMLIAEAEYGSFVSFILEQTVDIGLEFYGYETNIDPENQVFSSCFHAIHVLADCGDLDNFFDLFRLFGKTLTYAPTSTALSRPPR
jgi:hypothetical protein